MIGCTIVRFDQKHGAIDSKFDRSARWSIIREAMSRNMSHATDKDEYLSVPLVYVAPIVAKVDHKQTLGQS